MTDNYLKSAVKCQASKKINRLDGSGKGILGFDQYSQPPKYKSGRCSERLQWEASCLMYRLSRAMCLLGADQSMSADL